MAQHRPMPTSPHHSKIWALQTPLMAAIHRTLLRVIGLRRHIGTATGLQPSRSRLRLELPVPDEPTLIDDSSLAHLHVKLSRCEHTQTSPNGGTFFPLVGSHHVARAFVDLVRPHAD
jgi:hypothetical protein